MPSLNIHIYQCLDTNKAIENFRQYNNTLLTPREITIMRNNKTATDIKMNMWNKVFD